jgi:hypothetical protein
MPRVNRSVTGIGINVFKVNESQAFWPLAATH